MPTRFVILHHKFDGGDHWDLMFERGEVLLTWQLSREPGDRSCLPIPARRIADHRKAYLTYEGPIAGNRGHVHRVDAGAVEFEVFTGEKCVVKLQGKRLRGRYSLVRRSDNDDDWIFDKVDRQVT